MIAKPFLVAVFCAAIILMVVTATVMPFPAAVPFLLIQGSVAALQVFLLTR